MENQPEKEIRFAVVMYGGVSLAIYINGVTQELLSMVRATARSAQGDGSAYHVPQGSGVEDVYRRLGEYAKARFVVDILSGTSAGGINAVYLAKAIANDQPIDQLKKMWIDEGDIAALVNDKTSINGLQGLSVSAPPNSLLNSQRMYYKLLYALQKMRGDPPVDLPESSPYVEELDLFITATDLHGLALPVFRSRQAVPNERRFRNVFHFHYSTPRAAGGSRVNDFKTQNDPFLAFAARCTSSFPFAFEPMRLQDTKLMLGRGQFKEYTYQPDQWRSFYKGYSEERFPGKSFGDGGYLDNKPFSYATATLNRRRRDLPVDRKLVYIEPAPERIEDDSDQDLDPPDAIANVLLALTTLPRSETIREDLQLVTDRNDLIQGVKQIVDEIEDLYARQGKTLDSWMSSKHWRDQFLSELLDVYGAGYLAYHQLRVKEVLQNLSSMIARGLGWEEDGLPARDLSTLLHAWRHAYYKTSPEEQDPEPSIPRKSENDILFRLDATWRIRRLNYLRGLLDVLINDLGNGKFAGSSPKAKSILQHSQTIWPVNEQNVEEYRSALLWAKDQLNQAYVDLRGNGRAIRARGLHAQETGTDADWDEYINHLRQLKSFFEKKGRAGTTTQLEDLARLSAAKATDMPLNKEEEAYYLEAIGQLEALTVVISSRDVQTERKGLLRAALSNTTSKTREVLTSPAPEETNLSTDQKNARAYIRRCLSYYHDRFEYFDMLTYPLTFGTNVGESDEVEIIRISPEDATNIVPRDTSHTKLAGTKLGNFGAFFKREWRENDMLWGRLDGAECLIRAVLPNEQDESKRNMFIREAQTAILQEFFLSEMKSIVYQKKIGPQDQASERFRQVAAKLFTANDLLIEDFKNNYQVDQEFPPEPTLKVIGRASNVMGQLMGGLTDKYPLLNQPTGILSRFGSIFFTLVSVAFPQSLPNLIFRALILLIYLVELGLVAVGWAFVQLDTPNRGIDFTTWGTEFARLGANAVVVTLAAHLAIVVLGKVMSKRWTIRGLTRTLVYAAVVVMVIVLATVLYSGLVYLGSMPPPQGWIGRLLDLLKQSLGS